MTYCTEILSAVVVILFLIYYYCTSTFDFWKKLGVPGPRPIPGFGNVKDALLHKIPMHGVLQNIYEEYKNEPLVGIFVRRTPTLMIRDLDLTKDVLIKDFTNFADRSDKIPEKAEPLVAINMFNIDGERWRPLRVNLSPVFSSGKIKEMFHLIADCSKQIEKYIDRALEKGEIVDCREMAAKFTTDVIGSCAFGINMNAMTDEGSEFRRLGKTIVTPNLTRKIRKFVRDGAPKFYDILSYVLPPMEVWTFLTRVVTDTIKHREQNNIFRPDFVNTLMNLRKHPEKMENLEVTDNLLAAQSFVFFLAGFETSSVTVGCLLYELARNHALQDRLREEIKEHCGTDEDLKYDVIRKMKYLHKVFEESLRKYPPVTNLTRRSTSNYTFSGTKISIPKDTSIIIPLHAIHMDPNIFPNPEIFDPERFNEDAVAGRHHMSHLPFGDGPRNCIGARFAVFQVKVAIIQVLRKYIVDICEETTIKYIPHPMLLVLSQEGVRLKVTELND